MNLDPVPKFRFAVVLLAILLLSVSTATAGWPNSSELSPSRNEQPRVSYSLQDDLQDCAIAPIPLELPSERFLLRGGDGAYTSIFAPQTKTFACVPYPHTILPIRKYAYRAFKTTGVTEFRLSAPVVPRAP